MTQSEIKTALQQHIKAAMKSGEKDKLGVLRLISAAFKQREVDERVELDDAACVAILDKMAKQRRESIEQYQAAGRDDLTQVEQKELAIIQDYLPQALSDSEINAAIDEAISSTGATGIRDMGKVMGLLKPKLQGRADMSAVSSLVKTRLNG